VIQQNAGSAEEISSTAQELSSQAEQLQNSISFFTIEDVEESSLRTQKAKKAQPTPCRASFTPPAQKAKAVRATTALHQHPGMVLNMKQNVVKGNGDTKDGEFERF
jgi:methyl-accepting chemotaxis protein